VVRLAIGAPKSSSTTDKAHDKNSPSPIRSTKRRGARGAVPDDDRDVKVMDQKIYRIRRLPPHLGFGEHGYSDVRFAFVENRQRSRQAIRNIKPFLKSFGPSVLATGAMRLATA
jgi:hypothetical protein